MKNPLYVLIALGLAIPTMAAPLAPPLSTSNPTAGETALLSPFDKVTPQGYVDWMVLTSGSYAGTDFAPLVSDVFGATDIPTGTFLYAYKVESLINNGNSFAINLADPSFILSSGSAAFDLDLVGHNAANFPNLGPPPPVDYVIADKQPLVDIAGSPVISGNNITWQFSQNLQEGQETAVMWFTSNNIPTYRPANLLDTTPTPDGPGDGGDDNGTDGVPIPAPGAVVLGAIGLSIIGWIKRRLA